MRWVPPVESRDQLVLFPRKLDDALPDEEPVRQLAAIMDQVDWSSWEAKYAHRGPGRTAVHPKVMASVLLYGMLRRIRASRQLEEALRIRLDFRWLAEGRAIDHSTICAFRNEHRKELQDLFVQLGVLAHAAGILKLTELAFDGTRIRANNRRSGHLATEKLGEIRDILQRKYEEHVAAAEKLDAQSGRPQESGDASQELANIRSRLAEVQRALAEVERLQAAGEAVPKRLPVTDVNSRLTPNKDGGFAPNYTPGAMVDTESGLIVSTDVIADTDEKTMLPEALDAVERDLGGETERVLADGMFSSGPNLEAMEERGIELYSPVKSPKNNPAVREDCTEPVPTDQVSGLPTKKSHGKQQFDKSAFVYDEKQDVYHCPAGKPLHYKSTSVEKAADGTTVESRRYLASPAACAACALKPQCIPGEKTKSRQVQRDQFERLRDQLRDRMKTEAGRATYARRMGPGERPFAVIKQAMQVRQFLTRGLQNVKQEWLWLATAFNLKRLMPMLGVRAGPEPAPAPCPLPET